MLLLHCCGSTVSVHKKTLTASFLPKAWFGPRNRLYLPDRTKQCAGDPGDFVETVQIRGKCGDDRGERGDHVCTQIFL